MKAEHRKELQTNALAANLTKLIEGVKHKPSNQSMILIIFVAVVAVVGLTLYIISNRSFARNSEELRKLTDATNLTEVEKVAQQASGSLAGRLAQFQEARVELKEGLEKLGSPRDHKAGVEMVRRAGDQYAKLADQAKDIPVLTQEALLNAGKAKECLGDVDEAMKFYERLAKADPDRKSEAGKQAADRIEKIKAGSAQVKEFYQRLDDSLTKAKPTVP